MNLLWSQGQTIVYLVILFWVIGYRSIAQITLAFGLYIFRAPKLDTNLVSTTHIPTQLVSPAFGTILYVERTPSYNRVAIYLSLLDIHVQYAPCHGTVIKQEYHHGTFSPAFWKEKSDLNERLDTTLTCPFGTIVIRQIAGTIARTIQSFVQSGQDVHSGQQLGMIKLGSRVDVIVPTHLVPVVSINQRVEACKTVLFLLETPNVYTQHTTRIAQLD